MITNSVPCAEIIWAYHFRESPDLEQVQRVLLTNLLVLVTRRGKQYQFPMSEREVTDCLKVLKTLNPELVVGFPRGSRLNGQNLLNTRDLGALETEDGRHILPCRLLRSADLYHISLADKDMLETEYRVKTVIDLRSSAERRQRPDDTLLNVRTHHIPLLDESFHSFLAEPKLLDMITDMQDPPEEALRREYLRMIQDPYTIGQLALVIETIRKNGDGTVLFHCSLGKDRTDLVACILLFSLGVPKEVVREEFMRSNTYLAEEKNYILQLMEASGFNQRVTLNRVKALYEVRLTYLDSVFRMIENKWYSVDRFLRKGLYLTPKAIENLQSRFLI
jgi:protein-tyrosine phosphatase